MAQNVKKARQLQALEDEQDILELEMEKELEDELEEEPIEKDYSGNYEAKSFSELDQAINMEKKAEKVRETSWMVQDLVRNIISEPTFSPAEKTAAIKSVADDYGSRVASIMDSPMMKQADEDIDALILEATLARDKRNMSLTDGIKDLFSKATTTSSELDKLDDSEFAFIVEKDGKKIRKYPIHDIAHVRKALEVTAKMIRNGGEDEIEAKEALPQIRAKAKEIGISADIDKDNAAIVIEKDLNGDWRAVMWVSNNFVDWDGDIISEDAHKEYVEWVSKNKSCMPSFATWHRPGTARENSVDYIDYVNGFLIASAKLTEKEAIGLLKAKKLTNLGMSHGSFALERDPKDRRIVTKYRMYEVSDLPLENAANPFTNIETISKEVDMDKAKYLAAILGEEKAEDFLKKTELKQKELQEAGIEEKEKEEVPEGEPKTEEVVPETKEKEQPLDVDAFIERIKKELEVDGLSETILGLMDNAKKVEVLEGLVKDLMVSKEDTLLEMIAPPAGQRFPWTKDKQPSQREDNIVKENDAEEQWAKRTSRYNKSKNAGNRSQRSEVDDDDADRKYNDRAQKRYGRGSGSGLGYGF